MITTETVPVLAVERALEEMGHDPECYRRAYSGRGMYGETCLAVVLPRVNSLPVWHTVFTLALTRLNNDSGEQAAEMAMDACTDSLGTDTIVYYPGWSA